MADIEKAIGNLQILRTWCAVNPRYSKGLDAGECEKAVGWLDDALELLKKQGPVRRGRWKTITMSEATGYDPSLSGDDPMFCHVCSCCKSDAYINEFGEEILSDFCQNCGADMREVEKDG